MINGYNIRKINGEEVLCLYLDLSSEFANLDSKKNKNFKKEIIKYIKKNKINFKGVKVALIIGGFLVGTVILNSVNQPNNNFNNKSSIVAIMNEEHDNITSDNTLQEDEIKEEDAVLQDSDDNVDNKVNNVENNTKNQINKEKVKNKDNVVKESNNKVEVKKEEDIVKEKVIDNNIYVNVRRNNGNIEKYELEEYIIGVVSAEMPASFNKEALKAQSVVARTYALKSIKNNKQLTSDNSTQNFKDNNELKKMWGSSYNTYYNKIKSAVLETKGLYLSYNNDYVDAVYHSTSNGNTEDAVYVWGNSVPYLKSVSSEYDNTNKNYSSSITLTYNEISNKLKNSIDSNTKFNIISKTSGNRVKEIEINGTTYSGVEFRKLLNLRSADFSIENNGVNVVISTNGYGHGVGMSQYGANGMANNGSSYTDILLHYYTGVSIKNIY